MPETQDGIISNITSITGSIITPPQPTPNKPTNEGADLIPAQPGIGASPHAGTQANQTDIGQNESLIPAATTFSPVVDTDKRNSDNGLLLLNPQRLHLQSRPGRGRGVFAPCAIPAGTVLEEAPVLVISRDEWEDGKMNDSILGEYAFTWRSGDMAIGLGLAGMFNHSASPNVNYVRDFTSALLRFTTTRRVEEGEELCICYSADESKLWFTPSTAAATSSAALSPAPTSTISPPTSSDALDFLDDHGFSDEAAIREAEDRVARRKEKKDQLFALQGGKPVGRAARKAKWKLKQPQTSTASSPGAGPSNVAVAEGDETMSGTVTPPAESARFTPVSEIPLPSTILPAGEGIVGPLPAPLHSSGLNRRVSDSEAVLCPELEWVEAEWYDQSGLETNRKADGLNMTCVKRIPGVDDTDEPDYTGTLEVWVVPIPDISMTRVLLDFAKVTGLIDPSMRHLKRVATKSINGGTLQTMIALCATSAMSASELTASLAQFHESLAELEPIAWEVPAGPARSPEDHAAKAAIWPIIYSAIPPSPSMREWSAGRLAWIKAGVDRVLALALEAKAKGEIPVGVFCASPPGPLLPPLTDGFIPPTPGLRADACDTRHSVSHPLRHAALNCVAQIARIRTQRPFSSMVPLRNGADYLLTSMTLYITHEPCVMCAMALLHSRVKEVIYVFDKKGSGGGFKGFGVHRRKDLNHRFEVWRWEGEVTEEVKRKLDIGREVEC